jgi:hypothetical protein
MKKQVKQVKAAPDEEVYYLSPLGLLGMELGEDLARRVYDALELYARRAHPGAKSVGLVFTGSGGEFIPMHFKEDKP